MVLMIHLAGKPHYVIADDRVMAYLANRVKESYELMFRCGYTHYAREIFKVYNEIIKQVDPDEVSVVDNDVMG